MSLCVHVCACVCVYIYKYIYIYIYIYIQKNKLIRHQRDAIHLQNGAIKKSTMPSSSRA